MGPNLPAAHAITYLIFYSTSLDYLHLTKLVSYKLPIPEQSTLPANTRTMPVLIRRRPSLDLRKAAREAEQAAKFDFDSFAVEDGRHQQSEFDMDFPVHKLANLPSRQKARGELRLTTSSPVLHQQYQSDEEQPSPSPDDYESGHSEYESCGSEEEYEEDDEDEFEEDFDTPRALPVTFVAPALAIAMPIKSLGKPNVVSISAIAPMAKRTIPISRPQSASYTTVQKVKAPVPTIVRTSIYRDSMYSDHRPSFPRNFSTPLMQRSDSLTPPSQTSGSSLSTSPSNSSLASSEADEGELLIRESNEIQDRSKNILAGTEWDMNLYSPTPTNYAAYDPFALNQPMLVKDKEFLPEEKSKGWKRLGLRSKIMAASRRTRA